MFLDTDQFDFVKTIEKNWSVIKKEFSQLEARHLSLWPEKDLYNQNEWSVYGLYAFGHKLDDNCQRCPQTTHLVESIPGMTTAGFSALAAGTHIFPHTGYSAEVWRCHLGLIVPQGAQLRVGPETRQWESGKCLVFDDTVEHEAWNPTQENRVVLLIDFKKVTSRSGQSARPLAPPSIIQHVTAR